MPIFFILELPVPSPPPPVMFGSHMCREYSALCGFSMVLLLRQ